MCGTILIISQKYIVSLSAATVTTLLCNILVVRVSYKLDSKSHILSLKISSYNIFEHGTCLVFTSHSREKLRYYTLGRDDTVSH